MSSVGQRGVSLKSHQWSCSELVRGAQLCADMAGLSLAVNPQSLTREQLMKAIQDFQVHVWTKKTYQLIDVIVFHHNSPTGTPFHYNPGSEGCSEISRIYCFLAHEVRAHAKPWSGHIYKIYRCEFFSFTNKAPLLVPVFPLRLQRVACWSPRKNQLKRIPKWWTATFGMLRQFLPNLFKLWVVHSPYVYRSIYMFSSNPMTCPNQLSQSSKPTHVNPRNLKNSKRQSHRCWIRLTAMFQQNLGCRVSSTAGSDSSEIKFVHPWFL